MGTTPMDDQPCDTGLTAMLPHEIVLIKHFRKSNERDQHSIAEYAAECALGWYDYPDAGEAEAEAEPAPAPAPSPSPSPSPSDNLVNLGDCSFDFEDYFDRHREGRITPAESDEFKARIYGMFCRDVFSSGGDMRRVSFWAANYVAERLIQALGGVAWEDIMGLPWDEPTPFLTPKGERAFTIYAAVENTLREQPGANVTDIIVAEAGKHHISYPTARADYYKYKAIVEKKEEMPPNFLFDRGDK